MLQYRQFAEIIDHPGLRIVLVQGTPSPWGQAAKTIFEVKGLDYVAAPWLPAKPMPISWLGRRSQRTDRRVGQGGSLSIAGSTSPPAGRLAPHPPCLRPT